MDYFNRKKCRLCQSGEIEKVIKFADIPVGEKYFKNKSKFKNIKYYPMTLTRCKKCYHLQISEVINPEYLWSDYTYFSSQTKAILEHFDEFSKNVQKKFKFKKNDLVVDIGSNDGSLLNFFLKNVNRFHKSTYYKKMSHRNIM